MTSTESRAAQHIPNHGGSDTPRRTSLLHPVVAVAAIAVLTTTIGCSANLSDSVVDADRSPTSAANAAQTPGATVRGSAPAPITLTAAAATVPEGGSFTLTAKLPADAVGPVGFYDQNIVRDDKGIGVATIVDGTATLRQSTTALGPGIDHKISASWGGDAKYAASDSSPITLTVTAGKIPLEVPVTTFQAGSWGNGIIFEASGLQPNRPVTLVLIKITGPAARTEATKDVNTDSTGGLSSVWVPSEPPVAADASGYPKYEVYAYQDVAGSPPELMSIVALDIT